MKKIDQLWNGDLIKHEESGQIGTFEGKEGNHIRLKVDQKIVLIPPSKIYLLDEKEQEAYRKSKFKVEKPITTIKPKKKINVGKCIDLHMEVLDPTHSVQSPARILDFQINAFIEYIRLAVAQKHKVVTVIHGHGAGVLKREVTFILEGMDDVMFSNPINDGGAIEVWLKH